MPHSPGLGAIYGIVAENGVPKADSPVYLLDRTIPKIIRNRLTETDGGFVFTGLSTEVDDYMVVATDEDGSPPKNALIRDRIQPVSVHVGDYYPTAWYSKLASFSPAVVAAAPFASSRFETIPLLSPGVRGQDIVKQATGSWSYSDATPFEDGAFGLPVLSLTSESWLILDTQTNHQFVSTNPIFSTLVVADFTQPWGVTQRLTGDKMALPSDGYMSTYPLFHFSFDGINKITVEILDCQSAAYTGGPHWTTTVLKTYEQILTPVPSGFALAALSFKGGSVCSLYVDGTSFILDNTTVPSAVDKADLAYTVVADAALHGYKRPAVATGPRFVLYAFACKYLTSTEIQELDTLLHDGGFPTETGYARAITVDTPALYYRLDEVNVVNDAFSEHYEGDASTANLTNYAVFDSKELILSAAGSVNRSYINSPIVGRSACVFDGSWVGYGRRLGCQLGKYFGTFSFVFKQTARAGTQCLLLAADNPASSNIRHYKITLSASGALSLYLAGSAETLTFAYTFALDTWYVVHVVLDKGAESALLYVDGVHEQTISTTTTPVAIVGFQQGYSNPVDDHLYYKSSLVVGGVLSSSTVSEGFVGALAEIALYTYPLTAERITDQFANIDIA